MHSIRFNFEENSQNSTIIDISNRTLAKNTFGQTFSNYSIMLPMARLWKMSIREKTVVVVVVVGWGNRRKGLGAWSPNFQSCIEINKEMVAVKMSRVGTEYN